MTRWIGVLGTHGWKTGAWWDPRGLFAHYLRLRGLVPADPDRPFVWSGDLQGVPLIGAGKDWEAGAFSLATYLRALPYDDRNVIAHSHGGAVALLATLQTEIRSLITVGTPVRKAVHEAAATALSAGQIGAWTHIYDAKGDKTQWLGQLFDGRWFGARAFKLDGMVDDAVPGIGHSGVLTDQARFRLWVDRGWLDVLRASRHAGV